MDRSAFAPILAAISGAILAFPVLRMHGDYLAIVTLGFGEIIRLVLTSWVDITGGPNGIAAPSPTLFGLSFHDGHPLADKLFMTSSIFRIATTIDPF